MTKDHYTYISEHFNLNTFSMTNDSTFWSENMEGRMIPNYAEPFYDEQDDFWTIRTRRDDYDFDPFLWTLFDAIPSYELADEVCKMIIETEILFV